MTELSQYIVPPLRRLPHDLVQNILDQIRMVDWSGGNIVGQWPGNPFLWRVQRVESENYANISTKHTLSLVSKEFNALTKSMKHEHICVRNAHQLYKLGQSIRQYQSLTNSIARYTRRLDILISAEPVHDLQRTWNLDFNRTQVTSARSVDSVYTIAEALLRNCPSLTHLTITMFNEPVESLEGHGIAKVIVDSCPSLRVIHWRFGSKIRLAHLVQPFADNLRVLDLSKTALVTRIKDFGKMEMRSLHTVKGPIDIVCRTLTSVHLPSLHTLVLDFRSSVLFRPEDGREFFIAHRARIRSLVVLSPRLKVDLEGMDALNEFAFNAAVKDQLKGSQALSTLTRIGLMGTDSDIPEFTTLLIDKFAEAVNIVTHLCAVCDDILDSRKVMFPALTTVSIVDLRLLNHLQENWLACQKLIGRFLIAGIRFEDNCGQPIRAILGPQFIAIKEKTAPRAAFNNASRSHANVSRTRQSKTPRTKGAERRLTPVDKSGITKAFEFSLTLTPAEFGNILRN